MRGARPDRALAALYAAGIQALPAGPVLVALSGGPDSAAAALLTAEYCAGGTTAPLLVYVDHGLRRSARQDEAVAAAIAVRLELPLRILRPRISGTDEAALRAGRYAALAACAREHGAPAIITGHTANDQTETVLLALFRGTGPQGLAGMPARRTLEPGIELCRPLLRVERERLRRLCERRRIPYVLDPTNLDEEYRRNAVRRMLAELRPLFPGLDRAVARCAAITAAPGDSGHEALRAWLRELGAAEDVGAERLEAAVRCIELGRGRRIHVRFENVTEA